MTPLQALEEIKNHKIKLDVNIKYDNGDETQHRLETIRDMFPKQFVIIETTLKEYESMKQNNIIVADKMISNEDLEKLMNQSRFQFRVIRPSLDEETQKKLKALEIIKEKRVDIATLMDCLNVEECNRWVSIRSHYSYRPFELTQEEFDLLKEVLL